MTALVQNRKAKMLAVNCMPDHTHLFVGFKPSVLISDFIKEVKVESNLFVQSKRWLPGKFEWQDGYGVFSYSHSQIDSVIRYILTQEEHHRKQTFRDEYTAFLKAFDVPYNEQYLFEFIENIWLAKCCQRRLFQSHVIRQFTVLQTGGPFRADAATPSSANKIHMAALLSIYFCQANNLRKL